MNDIGATGRGRPSFNLLDQPWIRVTYLEGRVDLVSLRDLLVQAHRIREISSDMPQQTLPTLRMAEAVLYQAYAKRYRPMIGDDNPTALLQLWWTLWQTGQFDPQVIDDYLERYHDRFDLFDAEHPFYQTPGLTYSSEDKEYDSIGELQADVPKPKKFLFSMRAKNDLDSLTLAEAARWLVFLQAYDPAGIKSPVDGETHVRNNKVYPPKSKVGTGWLGALGNVYLEQDNLFATLMLNWCLVNLRGRGDDDIWFGKPGDLAPWEREPAGPDMNPDYHPKGIVDMLTLQSRRVRLIPDGSGSRVVGIIVCYGDVISADNMDVYEPMTAWRYGSENLRKKLGLPTAPRMPVTFTSDKAIWRQLQPLISAGSNGAGQIDDTRPGVIRWVETLLNWNQDDAGSGKVLQMARIHTQSMIYGPQNSFFSDAIDDSLDANLQLLHLDAAAVDVVVQVVERTEDSVKALGSMVAQLNQSAGNKAQKDRFYAAIARVKERAYASLDQLFRQRIAEFGPSEDIEHYRNDWFQAVHRDLVGVAGEYRDQSPAPSFLPKANGARSAEPIFDRFLYQLNKYLGPLPSREDEAASEKEVR